MSIRQQGGIFGRNPTFNNVTVDGVLTVDQIVEQTAAAGITLDGVTLKDGNVVLANGKGIDFSATPGTGTSELFDDYEEGTFTPVAGLSFNILGTWTVAGGVYTKVGRLVNFSARFTGTGIGFSTLNSSYYQFTGLPFAPAEEYTGAWSSAAIAASVSGLVSIVPGSSAFWLNAAQGTTGTSAIYASGTYYTNA